MSVAPSGSFVTGVGSGTLPAHAVVARVAGGAGPGSAVRRQAVAS